MSSMHRKHIFQDLLTAIPLCRNILSNRIIWKKWKRLRNTSTYIDILQYCFAAINTSRQKLNLYPFDPATPISRARLVTNAPALRVSTADILARSCKKTHFFHHFKCWEPWIWNVRLLNFTVRISEEKLEHELKETVASGIKRRLIPKVKI